MGDSKVDLGSIIESLQNYAASLPPVGETEEAAKAMTEFFKSLTSKVSEIQVSKGDGAIPSDYAEQEKGCSPEDEEKKSDQPPPEDGEPPAAPPDKVKTEAAAQRVAEAAKMAEGEGQTVDKFEVLANTMMAGFKAINDNLSALGEKLAAQAEEKKPGYPNPEEEKPEDKATPPPEEEKPAAEEDEKKEMQKAVAEMMKSMGFMPSSPMVTRKALGMESNSFFTNGLVPASSTKSSKEAQELAELAMTIDELKKQPFTVINRLRTQSGGWN